MTAAAPDAPSTPVDQDAIIRSFGELATIAPVALKVIEMVDDDDVGLPQLTDVISTDPGLAARLLRLANSAAYARGKEVTNLNRAAMLIGLRTLKLVTLGFSLATKSPSSGAIDSSLFWQRGLATAVLARRIALLQAPELSEDAFATGLLANVGKLALVDTDCYVELVAQKGPWITPAVEREYLGWTSDELTARILDNWGLPESMCEAVGERHPADIDGQPAPLSALLRLADHASVLLLADEPADVARAFDDATLAAAHLGMTMDDVEEVVATSGPELSELAGTFDLKTIETADIDEIVRSAQASLARISVDLASMLNEQQARNEELEETNQELAEVASTDALTGLANRRTFDAFLNSQLARRRVHSPSASLGLILMDLDHFKLINDTHGHTVGDEVLAEFGRRLTEGCRKGDLAARTGGEEFALVLPATSEEGLQNAAERMRTLLDGRPFETGAGELPVTASVGASMTDESEQGVEKRLYESADSALYESKANGRNRVTMSLMPSS